MKKIISFIIVFLGLILICLLCSFIATLIKKSNSDKNLKEEKISLEDGKLKVGFMEEDYELPEELKSELGSEISEEFVSPLKKIDESLGGQIAERLGREYVPVQVKKDLFEGLDKNSYDCVISAVTSSAELSKNYLLSESYYSDQENSYSVIIKKDNLTLLDEINEVIGQLKEEGFYNNLTSESEE